jgi:hypothetical protein
MKQFAGQVEYCTEQPTVTTAIIVPTIVAASIISACIGIATAVVVAILTTAVPGIST